MPAFTRGSPASKPTCAAAGTASASTAAPVKMKTSFLIPTSFKVLLHNQNPRDCFRFDGRRTRNIDGRQEPYLDEIVIDVVFERSFVLFPREPNPDRQSRPPISRSSWPRAPRVPITCVERLG